MSRPSARQNVLALDYGRARVGVAVADRTLGVVGTRPPLEGADDKRLLARIAALCGEEEVGHVVIGLPLELDGSTGPAARRVSGFAQRVADATGLPVELVDERLTTREAARRLGEAGHRARAQKGRIDGASAAVLLESWLGGQLG